MQVIYQYRCDTCGTTAEWWQGMGDRPYVGVKCASSPGSKCTGEFRRQPSRGNFATFAGSHRAEYGR